MASVRHFEGRFLPVLHGIGVSQPLDDLGHGRSLLTNGDVNAEQLLLIVSCIVEPLLVDDGVNGNCGFAGLTIANDQFTLTTTNGYQRIDGFDSSLKKLKEKKCLLYVELECVVS